MGQLKLTGKPRGGGAVRRAARAVTAEPGWVNPNAQMVMARTGAPSQTRAGQVVYRLRCGKCAFEYGCNGMDIKARKCPGCQDGVQGEALRENGQGGLFE